MQADLQLTRSIRRVFRPLVGILIALSWSVLASAASIEVAGGKDVTFCETVAKLFGELNTPPAELLKTVEWKPVELHGQGPKTRHCSSLDRAVFDFDNDGKLDLVVKTTFCMKGAPSDSFYVFPADSEVLEQTSWQDMTPLMATPDKFERTGGRYPLSSLPMAAGLAEKEPALRDAFIVHPFILDQKVYIALTDNRGTWTVIAKYLRGEQFEDQCYLKGGKK